MINTTGNIMAIILLYTVDMKSRDTVPLFSFVGKLCHGYVVVWLVVWRQPTTCIYRARAGKSANSIEPFDRLKSV